MTGVVAFPVSVVSGPIRFQMTCLQTRQNGAPRLRILQSCSGRNAPQW